LSTTDVFVGNEIYIRDQFGRQVDDNGVRYLATGTIVTDVGYNSITLNKALTGRIKEIQTELDFELKDADMDIIESRFLFEPF
jgi:hypothetical protein